MRKTTEGRPHVPSSPLAAHPGGVAIAGLAVASQNLDAFNAYRTTRDYAAWERELSDKMSDMVIAFARTGNPAADGVTQSRYDPKDARSIEVGDAIRVIPYPRRENLDFSPR